ncbi:DUF411 domain-containing protein [Myxococcota bacterium]|nr:DUF411 domain-containing protein [Myxococcota bacterium]
MQRIGQLGRKRSSVLVIGLALSVVAGIALGCRNAASGTSTIEVYKTATCGCCTKWIDHLEAAGFEVEATDLPDLASLKREKEVPAELVSCHTAVVDGYVIEGHVPAEDITRLLEERPAITGLAVPEMPLGSPGMEHPDPSRHQPFDVMAFGRDGVRVFASHPAAGARP